MNPGELKERISILSLNQTDTTYSWEVTSDIWSKVEQLRGGNSFLKAGMDVKTLRFTLRNRSDLTLHNAFSWKGKHCFLFDIKEEGSMYYKVYAALIEPLPCSAEQTGEPRLNELNRPVYDSSTIITFPGYLTEKSLEVRQANPMSYKESRYVLITPKSVVLRSGDLVTVKDVTYKVIISHTLNEYKNEYEITAKEDI